MIRFIGPLGVVFVLVVSILFGALNGPQRVHAQPWGDGPSTACR